MSRRRDRSRKRRRRVVGLVLVVGVAMGAWMADRALKQRRHPGLPRFLEQLVTNYPAGLATDPPVLHISIGEAEMDILRGVVTTARERGVILPEGRPYVGAELESEAGRFKAKLRIKGKMTDHVKDDKWSFRVVAKKDGGFLGMKRFSLQHPGTRNYLHEWLAHRLMAGEGIIALRYGFIRLYLNDDDLGIYAYEEHFGPELLEHNGRLPGPLFRFDPALFWEHRLNEMQGVRFNEPFAAYQAAALDAFDSSELVKDSVFRSQFEEAVAMMEAFRRGTLSASAVFDADRIARRHALLDLVGGHHSMDWSDVKFYYDPVVKRVEPVAYESFSAFPIRTLAGSGRWTGRFSPAMELHDAYFNDEAIFRAYVHHLERIARPDYLDSVFTTLGPALDSTAATVYREFPWKELDRSVYRHNQQVVRRLLDVPKGFHAYLQGTAGDTLTVVAVPIEALPVEVHGIIAADGTLMAPVHPVILPVRPSGRPGDPVPMRFVLPAGMAWPAAKDLRIRYSVLGAAVRKELEVFPHALLLPAAPAMPVAVPANDLRKQAMLAVDEAARQIVLKPGKWVLEADLHIPAGYRVEATAPLQIELRKGARITSRSPMDLRGLPDAPIAITSPANEGGGLLLLECEGTSTWQHVRIGGMGATGGAAVTVQASDIHWNEVALAGDTLHDLLLLVRGTARITGLHAEGGRDALTLAHGHVRLDNAELRAVGDDGITVSGAQLELRQVVVDAAGVGLKVGVTGQVQGSDLQLTATGRGIVVEEAGRVRLDASRVSSGRHALDVRKAHGRYGPSTVTLTGVALDGAAAAQRIGAGNTVELDGVPQQATPQAEAP